ncbi:hypothetical protein DRQ05_03510 [bacterium]|nr:MAG: hypothetical protein DRQ05_03510 [bacterium]
MPENKRLNQAIDILSGFDPEVPGVQCEFSSRLYKITFPMSYPPGWEAKITLSQYVYWTKERKFRFMGKNFDTLEDVKTFIKEYETNVFTEQDIQYARTAREQAIKDAQRIGQRIPDRESWRCQDAPAAEHCYHINHLDIRFLPEPPMELVGKRRNGCLDCIVSFIQDSDIIHRCHPAKFRQGLKKALALSQ